MNEERFQTELSQLYQHTFTVFTPTRNRAYTLHRVYESLKAQTFRDFEWLIVDNESTDNTTELVKTWQSEAYFPIRYIYKENQGVHVSWNRGVREARGELFVYISSDDACVPEALERFKFHWDSIQENERGQFSTVTALCVNQHGKIEGRKFPMDIVDSSFQEIRYKYRDKGEKWGCFRTDILKKYPFHVIEGSIHAPEGIVWREMGKMYRTRYINEVLHIFWIHPGQLTKSAPSRHAAGQVLWHKSVLNNDIGWFLYAPEEFLRSSIHYSRFSFHTETGILAQVKSIESILARILWMMMLPLGFLLYWRDKKMAQPMRPATMEV